MERRNFASLDDLEEENRRETLKGHASDLALIERVLNDFLPAFDALHGYRIQEQWERLLLILTAKAFNSLRCAFDALLRAYYAQALTLVRTVEEDLLTCWYVNKHRGKASLWLEGRDVPRFKDMRLDLEDVAVDKLRESYGILSTFAHPRARALAVTVDRLGDGLGLRVGGQFDSDHFTAAAYSLLGSATSMLSIPAIFLHDSQPEWFERITATRDEVIAWVQRVNQELVRRPP